MTQSEPNPTDPEQIEAQASADHERRIEEAEMRVIAAARAFDAFEGHKPKEMDSEDYSMHLHILRDELEDALNALTTPVESLPEKVEEWEGFRLWECELGCCQIVNGHGHQWYRMRRRDGWEAWAPSPVAMQSCPPKWTHRHGHERLAILRTLPPEVRAAKGGGK